MSLDKYIYTLQVTWYKSTMKLMDGQRILISQVGNSYKLTLENLSEKVKGLPIYIFVEYQTYIADNRTFII